MTENVAEAQSSAQIHELWMQSPGHRANLLDDKVDAIGISVIQDRGQLYAVEDFARTVEQVPLAQQESDGGRAAWCDRDRRLRRRRQAARQTCAMSTGYAGSRQPWFVMRYTSADLKRLPDELTSRLATGKYHEAAGRCLQNSGSRGRLRAIAWRCCCTRKLNRGELGEFFRGRGAGGIHFAAGR